MSNTALTLHKLMILYMLNKIDYPMKNARISDFMLELGYASYFNVQTAISELIDSNLIKSETTLNSSFFRATPDGKHTLELLADELSPAIKKDINTYIDKISRDIRKDLSTISNFNALNENEYVVNLKMNEGNSPLLEIAITVPSKLIAQRVCTAWEKKSDDVYSYLFNYLLLDKPK